VFPYFVCEFAKETLSNLVKECFGSTFPDVIRKRQINYIYNYLKDLDAKSILLEASYVDKDYLEDYSGYYVKCFSDYGAKCARLHFFNEEVDHGRIEKLITEGKTEDVLKLQNSYLGFVVIKPLPKTFVGKTCLEIYPSFESEATRLMLSRKYYVNLFGIELSINSVAFQEQDKVLSACASTAIWTSLHAIRWMDTRQISSSGEITASAINHISGSSNRFPNNGLTNKQILRALDVEGLKHYRLDVEDVAVDLFFNTVRRHINSGLPVILGANIYDINDGGLIFKGGHAVSVLGFKEIEGDKSLYIHDDRIGPFARANIVSLSDCGEGFGKNGQAWGLVLQEKDDKSDWMNPHQVLIPESLIMPSDKKGRISEFYVRNTCECIVDGFNSFVDKLEQSGCDASHYLDKVSYDFRLYQIGDLKKEILGSSAYNKKNFLLANLARLQWKASIFYDSEIAFDIVLDATDIPQGDAISAVVIYNKDFFDLITGALKQSCKSEENDELFGGNTFFSSFMNYLDKDTSDFHAYLDKMYGPLRAPKYLKKQEVERFLESSSQAEIHYGSIGRSLDEMYGDLGDGYLIWAISAEGGLIIGEEKDGLGHPSITGFKAARIAGELKKPNGKWEINAKSGRYSKDYDDANQLLENALLRFKEVFQSSEIEARPYHG